MKRAAMLIAPWLVALWLIVGCSARSDRIDPSRGDVIFFVPGVGGARANAQNFILGLHDARVSQPVQIVRWGAPLPFFFLNFSNAAIHDDAERKLADRIADWRTAHPNARIDIIAHSAGCGVTLGALQRLAPTMHVQHAILLAPSVSPIYPLDSSMPRISESLHVFASDRDRTFLEWRTRTFGTYDGVKTAAAGNRGFVSLPPRAVQHRYDPSWQALGNQGDHFGPLARDFARDVIAPLLSSPAAPGRSSAANPR